ncbi:MAG: hypothetical protein K2L99_03625 [Muribaculaceae bacterium]|nr:hypothetical protein [Muribaculaceae bacterium]MDE6286065.1 hypothetical protein [Muribaculaceae bacterium]
MFNFFSKKETPRLWFSTDIHCHVLPGIDDGSASVEESIQLIERMQGWGISRIFASPHVTRNTFENTPETIAAARASLQSALDAAGNPLVLSNSAEYRLDDLFDEHRSRGMLLTLPGNRLLIENSFMQERMDIEQLVFDLQMDGYVPILVHPERYHYYRTSPSRYRTLHDAGARFQINLLSLAGHYGKDEKRTAELLIEQGLVDYVGTDLHHAPHADSIEAYLGSRDFRRHAAALQNTIKNDAIR